MLKAARTHQPPCSLPPPTPQDIPFLRKRLNYADIDALVLLIRGGNGSSGLNVQGLISFTRTTVAPALGANAALLVLALIFILIFVLW